MITITGPRRNESGATLVLVAFMMVALLTMAAIVLDTSLSRTDRRVNKSIADSAAIAGASGLKTGPWPAVCEAYNYVRANARRFPAGFTTETWTDAAGAASYGTSYATSPCGTPSAAYSLGCSPANKATWPLFKGTAAGGDVEVIIQSGYELPDPSVPEDSALSPDDGAPCDHVAVKIRDTREPGFGQVVNANPVTTNIRSVARLTVGVYDVAALVILEKTDCMALRAVTNGGKIEVLSSGNRPGIIQIDSAGSTNCNGSDRVLFGSQLPATNLPNIIAKPTTGVPVFPGRIGIYAKSQAAGFAWANTTPTCANETTSPCTISPDPIGADQLTRKLVDERYLGGLALLRSGLVTKFAQDPYPLFTPLTSVPGFPGCNFSATFVVTDPDVYIDCDLKVNGGSLTFSAPGSRIITSGTIDVGSSGTLTFDDPRELFIQGTTSGGPNASGINVLGNLNVNSATAADCAARHTVTTKSLVTKFVVGDGGFNAGGSAAIRMCQTTLFMMAGSLGTVAAPPPINNSYVGWVRLGGQGVVDWSAPNIEDAGPAVQTDWDKQEDLALWSEAAAVSNIGGGGALELEGVFVVPNADPFRITGQGGDTIGANAQFWTRKLELSGAALLQMAPNPNDSVPSYDIALVR